MKTGTDGVDSSRPRAVGDDIAAIRAARIGGVQTHAPRLLTDAEIAASTGRPDLGVTPSERKQAEALQRKFMEVNGIVGVKDAKS